MSSNCISNLLWKEEANITSAKVTKKQNWKHHPPMIFITLLTFGTLQNAVAFGQNFELQLQFGREIMSWQERIFYFIHHKFLVDSYVKKAI